MSETLNPLICPRCGGLLIPTEADDGSCIEGERCTACKHSYVYSPPLTHRQYSDDLSSRIEAKL